MVCDKDAGAAAARTLVVASEGEDVPLIEFASSVLLLHEQGNMDQHSTLPVEMLNQTDGEDNVNRKAMNSIVSETAIVESAKVDLNDGVSLEGEARLSPRPMSMVLEQENLVQDGPLMANAGGIEGGWGFFVPA
ncbi:hypothetical protein AMTR_s00051p00221240 [Amborella trichopoda]|uniref:Uncharacterized protein n=1 Tax=Amborella trichopoda TaxID=13333 RepID=U5CTT5_AMBTC|nr:hypothetical protein AMTR_s00051p00221240 [Amborella trichopoda]